MFRNTIKAQSSKFLFVVSQYTKKIVSIFLRYPITRLYIIVMRYVITVGNSKSNVQFNNPPPPKKSYLK